MLSTEQLNNIKQVIEINLLKRGFTAPIVEFEMGRDRGFWKIILQTDKFQTTPVIFRDIKIEAFNSSFNRRDVDQSVRKDFYISIHVRYNRFCGGSNGCELFTVQGGFLNEDAPIYELKIS